MRRHRPRKAEDFPCAARNGRQNEPRPSRCRPCEAGSRKLSRLSREVEKSSPLLGGPACTAPSRRHTGEETYQGDIARRHPEETSRGDIVRTHRPRKAEDFPCAARSGRRNDPRPSRCDTWRERGRLGAPFSRDSRNPQPFWCSSDVQPGLPRRHPGEETSRGDIPRRHPEETS